ncbi:UNVERIFIED_CONTAM: hypothetical protein Slati_4188600 [Sesamum latifolium]|uniref:Integrase catalytic domain-containing protein n=1 Tax=Sesamum latifolium TaxID=2727402 RepID=A0AAW2TBC7_9LAMI
MATQSLAKLIRRKNHETIGELLLSHQTLQKRVEDNRVLVNYCNNAIPKKQHPYRYAYGQKTEIERIVKETLDSGIIRPSQSSFASPVQLVKKKYGVYSKDWGMHLVHLKKVMELLKNISLMQKKEKFIKGYGTISKPLTSLLKKDAFEWNADAKEAFNQLKEVMTTAPVLAMPYFFQPFVVETDACGGGIGEVLMQEGDTNQEYSEEEVRFVWVVMKELQKKSSRHYRTQPEGGHSGINGTYQRIKPLFYWSTMKSDVQNLVKECEVCQRSKHENNPYSGLLHPLPIPEQAWSSISMDFIEGLPNSEGKDFILVGVDRLTKFSHFIALKHPYTATSVAKVFFENIYKVHGLPVSIAIDRNKVFTSRFWKELFTLFGVSLDISSAYHP